MSEHVWAQDNIAVYVAGGLDAFESERLEKHVADCPACAQLVAETRSLEKKLAPLVRAAAPGSSLEDRIIQSLPPAQGTPRMNAWSGRRKAYLAAAAAVLLAALGAGLSGLIQKKGLGFPATAPVRMAQSVGHDRTGDILFVTGTDYLLEGLSGTNGKDGNGKQTPPSADDMAKELRDETVAQLSKEGDKAENKLSGLAHHRLNVESEPGESKAPPRAIDAGVPVAPPVSQPVSGGGSSTATTSMGGSESGPSRGFRGFWPSSGTLTPDSKPSLPQAWADYDHTFRATGPAADKGDKDAKKNEMVWNYTNNGTLPNLGTTFFKPGDDKAVQENAKEVEKKSVGFNTTLPKKHPTTGSIHGPIGAKRRSSKGTAALESGSGDHRRQ